MTIRELLVSGKFRETPITEIVELMAMELNDTMTGVQAIAQCLEVSKSVDSQPARAARPVRKAVRQVREDVELAPMFDHESESNCHTPGELAKTDPNQCLDSIFKYYL